MLGTRTQQLDHLQINLQKEQSKLVAMAREGPQPDSTQNAREIEALKRDYEQLSLQI